MKALKKIILLFTFTVCLLVIYGTYNYYAPPYVRDSYPLNPGDDTLRIAYIGDSWAAMYDDHNSQIAKLLTDTIKQPVKVYSHGICGLTSKEIYNSFFDNTRYKEFLQKRGYQYCFISAGINDTYKKMSVQYYQQSMNAIIEFFIANNVRPIILEIPDYDILKTYHNQLISRKILRKFSMFLNNTPLNCKQQFRDVLTELISEKGYQEVSIVKYRQWNNNYKKDMKQLYLGDGMHLNAKGYAKLDSVIAQIIIHEHTSD